jgi:hypothetical protein
MLVLAALILVAGIVVYLQKRADQELAPPAVAPAQPARTPAEPAIKPGGKLDANARLTAITFIRTALGRTNLQKAWSLATPDLRNGVTKKQWLRGTLPFPPFPVAELETTGFKVLGTSPKETMLEVLLVPELKSGYVPTRYEVTLVRKGAKAPWRVSYFLPYAPPGKYVEPNG